MFNNWKFTEQCIFLNHAYIWIVKLQDTENSVHHNLFCNLIVPFCNKLAELRDIERVT